MNLAARPTSFLLCVLGDSCRQSLDLAREFRIEVAQRYQIQNIGSLSAKDRNF